MLSWLLYGIAVGSLLTVGAHCTERLCQVTSRPTRWVWTSALLLMVVLMGIGPYRARWSSSPSPAPRIAAPTSTDVSSRELGAIGSVAQSFEVVRREVTRPIERTIAIPEEHLAASAVSLDRLLFTTWAALSTVVLLAFATAYLHIRRVRQQWPIHELHGIRVRLTPNSGPAVVGLVHPEIVIPQWLLTCPVEQQRAVLVHEHEHTRAGDPWLLAIACVITAAFAWHPVVWWMASRLRLALELDCDARAIRHGFVPQIYGSILIDLTERCSGVPGSVLALADRPSHLKRRLLAMNSRRPRFAVIQGGFFGLSALFFVITACMAQNPARMERRENSARWDQEYQELVNYYRDAGATYLGAVTPEDSARMFFDVRGNTASRPIETMPPSMKWISLFESEPVEDSARARFFAQEEARNAAVPNKVRDSVLVFVDHVRRGVFPINKRIPFNQLNLKPKDIREFEVKRGGHWAVVLYGPDAANGVVDIITEEAYQKAFVSLQQDVIRRRDSLKQWTQIHFSTNAQAISSQTWMMFFRGEVERSRLRDSVLVLADSVRRAVFPLQQQVSFDRLRIDPKIINYALVTTGSWAVERYGPDAAHGVINFITKAAPAGRDSVNAATPTPNLPPIDTIELATDAASLRKRFAGAVTLLHIWAAWAPTSREELPQIQQLYEALASKGLKVVAVSIDKRSEDIRTFVRDFKLSFDVLQDSTLRPRGGIPESFLLNRHGVVVKGVLGVYDWNSPESRALIERLLAEP